MAQLIISPEAVALALDQQAQEAMRRPVLSVGWAKGQRDNVRGENGQVVWRQTMEPQWYAYVWDWPETEGVRIEPHSIEMHGLRVLIDPTAREAPGSLSVTAKDGQLVIEHSAA